MRADEMSKIVPVTKGMMALVQSLGQRLMMERTHSHKWCSDLHVGGVYQYIHTHKCTHMCTQNQ